MKNRVVEPTLFDQIHKTIDRDWCLVCKELNHDVPFFSLDGGFVLLAIFDDLGRWAIELTFLHSHQLHERGQPLIGKPPLLRWIVNAGSHEAGGSSQACGTCGVVRVHNFVGVGTTGQRLVECLDI